MFLCNIINTGIEFRLLIIHGLRIGVERFSFTSRNRLLCFRLFWVKVYGFRRALQTLVLWNNGLSIVVIFNFIRLRFIVFKIQLEFRVNAVYYFAEEGLFKQENILYLFSWNFFKRNIWCSAIASSCLSVLSVPFHLWLHLIFAIAEINGASWFFRLHELSETLFGRKIWSTMHYIL